MYNMSHGQGVSLQTKVKGVSTECSFVRQPHYPCDAARLRADVERLLSVRSRWWWLAARFLRETKCLQRRIAPRKADGVIKRRAAANHTPANVLTTNIRRLPSVDLQENEFRSILSSSCRTAEENYVFYGLFAFTILTVAGILLVHYGLTKTFLCLS